MRVTAEKRRRFEEKLQEELQRAVRLVQRLTEEEREPQSESAGDVHYPQHLAELGSEAQEAETDFALVSMESERIREIEEALRLLREDPERYFMCENGADHPIEEGRLELLPWTRLCVLHARTP
jgi:RNA polymerase-binding transcription factor DksA